MGEKLSVKHRNDAPFQLKQNTRECGFYIACDDRSILNCVNAMLLNNGMVGLSDTEGKMHYLIDGRRGGNYVLQQVKNNVLTLKETVHQDVEYEAVLVRQVIDIVLNRYDFQVTLVGTQLIRFALEQLYQDSTLIKCVSKRLYIMVGEAFQMSVQQVERNIRYSIKKSKPIQGRSGIQAILRYLRDEIVEEVFERYGRPY